MATQPGFPMDSLETGLGYTSAHYSNLPNRKQQPGQIFARCFTHSLDSPWESHTYGFVFVNSASAMTPLGSRLVCVIFLYLGGLGPRLCLTLVSFTIHRDVTFRTLSTHVPP